MIEHLRETHKIEKQGAIAVQLKKGQIQIVTTFGNTRPQIVFNQQVFRNMLLHGLFKIISVLELSNRVASERYLGI